MLSLLPDFADPLRLSALGKAYAGEIALASLPRVAAILASVEGSAAFSLAFDRDDERRAIVAVSVRAELPLQCQRCLGTVRVAVDVQSRLAVVSGPEEAERLPAELDPLLVSESRLELRSLIEDELLLAVPSAPMHQPEACAVSLEVVNRQPVDGDEADAEQPASPFAALADWQNDNKRN